MAMAVAFTNVLASVGWAGLITILIQRRVPLAAAPAKGSA